MKRTGNIGWGQGDNICPNVAGSVCFGLEKATLLPPLVPGGLDGGRVVGREMRVLKVLDDLLLAEGGLVLVDGERSSGSLGLGLRGGLRRGRLLLLQFLLCGELCGLVGFGLFLLLWGVEKTISPRIFQIESFSGLTILLRGGRIRRDGGGGVFSRHGGMRSSDEVSRRRREGEGRGGSEEKMPSSAEQAARRNQHPGVVEGSMAGGSNGGPLQHARRNSLDGGRGHSMSQPSISGARAPMRSSWGYQQTRIPSRDLEGMHPTLM